MALPSPRVSGAGTVRGVTEETLRGAAGPRFGEQGGLLTYGAYLRLADLLDQQVAESSPPAHDELLFITIHQVYELWFKLLLAELTDARDRMLAGESYLPRVRLERCHDHRAGAGRPGRRDRHDDPAGLRRIPEQAGAGVGLPVGAVPRDRVPVGAEGSELPGRFRGLSDAERAAAGPPARRAEPVGRVPRRARQGGLRRRYGAEQRFAAYVRIARDRERYGLLWDLAEAMIAHDQAWSLWRGGTC